MNYTVKCRGTSFVVNAEYLSTNRVPRLNALLLGPWAEVDIDSNEASIDVDPVFFAGVIVYCKTGLIDAALLTGKYYQLADYWGITSATGKGLKLRLDLVRETFDLEAAKTDMKVFIERMWNTLTVNTVKQIHQPLRNSPSLQWANNQTGLSGILGGSLAFPCREYVHDDKWKHTVDAYKYVVTHSDLFRTLAFQEFGLAVSVEFLASEKGLAEAVVCTKDWGKADDIHGEVRFGYLVQQHEAQSPYEPLIVKAVPVQGTSTVTLEHGSTVVTLALAYHAQGYLTVSVKSIESEQMISLSLAVYWLKGGQERELWERDAQKFLIDQRWPREGDAVLREERADFFTQFPDGLMRSSPYVDRILHDGATLIGCKVANFTHAGFALYCDPCMDNLRFGRTAHQTGSFAKITLTVLV
jgi:hypothetical protein